MSLAGDLKILYHLALAPIRGRSHQERLDSFYAGQAEGYDAFRRHLLKGREELYAQLPVPEGGVWYELGGGTGHNLEYLGERLRSLAKVVVVDLSESLLEIARRRVEKQGWTNVDLRRADVTALDAPDAPDASADVVTFSYSLTMIPDWFAAIDRAHRLLRPGGTLGVVDFHVSRKYPEDDQVRHSWLTRSFWPAWLGLDNVHPSPDHLPYLRRNFATVHLSEHRTRMRYFPLARVPYYRFLGRKG